jgi:hypothetical protein
MVKCGTELSKMSHDIVILDDDLSTILFALKWEDKFMIIMKIFFNLY